MIHQSDRPRRVAELVRRELAILIQREMDDPAIRGVSLTAVEMSRDLRLATVYFSEMPGSVDATEAERHLNHATGFLRRLLGQRIDMRRIPELRFRFDTSIERGAQLSRLIDSLATGDEGPERNEG